MVAFIDFWEEHLDHLHKVLNCLHKANLTIKMTKCQFGRNEVHHLNQRREEVKPDFQKLQAVKDYPTSVCKKEVRAFLGLTRYYCHFVQGF